MKKSCMILAGVCFMAASHASAAVPTAFDDSSSFVVASAKKLGRGSATGSAFSASLATNGGTTGTSKGQDTTCSTGMVTVAGKCCTNGVISSDKKSCD